METIKNHFDLSLPHSIDSYIKSLLHHTKNPGKVYIGDIVLEHSKNYIAILSKEGHFQNTSSSFAKLLGYSVEELRVIPLKDIIVNGDFTYLIKATAFYFENTICCKNKSTKKIKWRFIPDVIDDAAVFVGWVINLA